MSLGPVAARCKVHYFELHYGMRRWFVPHWGGIFCQYDIYGVSQRRMFMSCPVLSCPVLCRLWMKSLHTTDHRSGEIFKLSPWSYMRSIGVFSNTWHWLISTYQQRRLNWKKRNKKRINGSRNIIEFHEPHRDLVVFEFIFLLGTFTNNVWLFT